MNDRLLLVEDDADLSAHLAQYLRMRGFEVDCADNGMTARQQIREARYDLLLIDVMMPGEDGFSLARHLKGGHPQLPFLFLTARNQKTDKLKGLGLGTDDYITKPFDADELVLRVHNILKRSRGTGPEPEGYQLGAYHFSYGNLQLTGPSGHRALTEREARLLRRLCLNKNQLVDRDEILRELWGEPDFFNGRSLDVFISRLRKYLSGDPQIHIEVIRGVGFRLGDGY